MGYTFILSQFGLQSLNVREFKQDEALESNNSLGALAKINGPDIPAEAYSYLGTPVIGILRLESQDGSQWLNLNNVILEVSMSKNIIKTQINGRQGTIKEYVSDGDFQIAVKGALTNNEDAYRLPLDELKALISLCSLPESLKASAAFFQLFGIHNIVIESYSFPVSEGFQNMQFFELSCVSDIDFRLLLDEPRNAAPGE